MFFFKDWELSHDGGILARQYDHLSRALLVQGVPEGYDWKMLVRMGDRYEAIPLAPMEDGVGSLLTEGQLALSGWYAMQLAGTLRSDGETVRHTNVISVLVPQSLSGGDWPASPSEFIRLEANVRELNGHPPIPGENGFWMVWELESHSYVQSAFPLPEGLDGRDGKDGRDGVDGKDGVDGRTPVRGVDYWTGEDVQSMVDAVLAALPNGDEVSY